MYSTITQRRLSMRLDRYQRDYVGGISEKDDRHAEEWDTIWHRANAARATNNLTPELVDDVRIILKKFGWALS